MSEGRGHTAMLLLDTNKTFQLNDSDVDFVISVLREAEEMSLGERLPGPPTLRHVLSAFTWLISRSAPENTNQDTIYQFLLQLSSRKETSWWQKLDLQLQVSLKKLRH